MLDAHRALIWSMVLVSAADGNMTDPELKAIGENVLQLQAFNDFDPEALIRIARECTEKLAEPEGMQGVIDFIRASLPTRLRETAFMLACDIARADVQSTVEEVRLLKLLRDGLEIDPLIAAALERGSRARHQRV